MSFHFHTDNLGYLLLGCLIGYVVRLLQDIMKKVDEVDDIVKGVQPDLKKRGQRGYASKPLVLNIALAAVIFMTAFGAFKAQTASNEVKAQNDQLAETQKELKLTQERLDGVVTCIQSTVIRALSSLNARSTDIGSASQQNVELQKAQAEMFKILLHQPPYSGERRAEAVAEYFNNLTDFVNSSGRTTDTRDSNPYPTPAQLVNCILTSDKTIKENTK